MQGARDWVIMREGPAWPQEVIGIVSARRNEKFIRHTLELLSGLLHYNAEEQLAAARWNKPEIAYRASAMMVGHRTAYHCGHNPYLIARLARKVRLDAARKVARLEWQDPDRFELSNSGPAKKTGGGSMSSAPVRFVFHRLDQSSRMTTNSSRRFAKMQSRL